jgi:hypothetical protein
MPNIHRLADGSGDAAAIVPHATNFLPGRGGIVSRRVLCYIRWTLAIDWIRKDSRRATEFGPAFLILKSGEASSLGEGDLTA